MDPPKPLACRCSGRGSILLCVLWLFKTCLCAAVSCLQAYISGNALIILDSPNHVVQTIYIDQEDELEAVALDENSGKLATCSTNHVYIYEPYINDDDPANEVVKVGSPQLEA